MAELRRCKGTWAYCDGDCEKCTTTATTQTTIMYLIPPTADVVEVVRCKDCQYFDQAEKYCCDFLTAEEDGFCKWGKRREDEESTKRTD